MDIGYWIRSFQIHYLRAKGLSGYIMSLDYSQVIYWNYLLLWTLITSWRCSIYNCKWIWYLLDIIMTMSILFNATLHSRLVTYTSHVNKTISSSDVAIINVCIYSGTRFAPIYVPNSASSVCITIFFLWHMCVMFYSVTCHCIF